MSIIRPPWMKSTGKRAAIHIQARPAFSVIPGESQTINRTMQRIIAILCIIWSLIELNGQSSTGNLIGRVSFISSQNVYVKFKSTSGISVGDTLFISSGEKLVPSLMVNNLSSVSCLCSPITDENIPLDHIVIARVRIDRMQPKVSKPEVVNDTLFQKKALADSVFQQTSNKTNVQVLRGSISVNSYSDFSNTGASNSQRFRYTLSLNTGNIGGSKLSAESYFSFRHKSGEWLEVKNDVFAALKIYSLAVRYDLNKSTSLSIGRRINPRISSIGAMDGIQFEKSMNKLTVGVLAGSRPDYTNYGVDLSLFQYGGYLSISTGKSGNTSESSVAFVTQTNNFTTDRRFLYFQHSNTLIKNLFFLSTLELDLFKLENDIPKNTLDLTGTYLALSYRVSGKLSLSGSYDARRNVMYYETYRTYVDRLLENELRQGFRLGGNLRLAKNMFVGLQSGYRFLKSDPHPSRNLYGYFTYSRIPGVNLSATISGTYLESGFINSKIAGLNLLKDFPGGKVQTGIGYHLVDNTLPENRTNIIQHVGEINLYWQFYEKMSLSVSYEGTFEPGKSYNRVYLQVRKRF